MKRIFSIAILIAAVGSTAMAADFLSFTLDTPPYRKEEARVIAGQLKALGIEVKVETRDKNLIVSEVKKGKRTAYLTDWGSAFFDPFDLAQPKLTTNGRGNFSFYTNPKVDSLLEYGAYSNDTSSREKAYFDIQNIVFKQAPWVFGYSLDILEAASDNVIDFKPAMDNRINLHDVGLKQGDTLAVGMNAFRFLSLDPAMYRGRPTETMLRNMFDGLVTRTPDGRVVPELAESWRQVDDLTYELSLRRGSYFHNGDPVTAEDVVFTFERILTPGGIGGKSSPRKDLLGPLTQVTAVGPDKVRFVLGKPFPAFLQALVHFQIVPRKYIEVVGNDGFAMNPVGAGPFKLVRADLETEVVMERFDDYYGGSPDLPPVGPAKIKQAVFRAMPDAQTRVNALRTGEVSIIQDIPLSMQTILSADGLVNVVATEGTRSYQIELNTNKPPFKDIRVRKALNMAIDWDVIIKGIYRGRARRLATCFLPSGFGYDNSLKPYEYDPGMARRLLDEAGYAVKW